MSIEDAEEMGGLGNVAEQRRADDLTVDVTHTNSWASVGLPLPMNAGMR